MVTDFLHVGCNLYSEMLTDSTVVVFYIQSRISNLIAWNKIPRCQIYPTFLHSRISKYILSKKFWLAFFGAFKTKKKYADN